MSTQFPVVLVPSTQRFQIQMVIYPMLGGTIVCGIVAAVLVLAGKNREGQICGEFALVALLIALIGWALIRRMKVGYGISLLGVIYGILLITGTMTWRLFRYFEPESQIATQGIFVVAVLIGLALLRRDSLMPRDPRAQQDVSK